MCKLKSGIIFRNRIELAPMTNESHSRILEKLHIEDSNFNAMKVFVRAELTPPGKDITADISRWTYRVDQDLVPEWYDEDKTYYEELLRNEVKKWVDEKIISVCGQPCTVLKESDDIVYLHLCNSLFNSQFGDTNDYRKSIIREELNNHDFLKALKDTYGDGLVPIDLDLTSLDGLKDYGTLKGDLLLLMNIDLYRECRDNILCGDDWWWLSTPDSTPSGWSDSDVHCVASGGDVGCNVCFWGGGGGVRPFFILKSKIFKSIKEKKQKDK